MRDWLFVAVISVFAGLGGWQIGLSRSTKIEGPLASLPAEAPVATTPAAPAEPIDNGTMSETLNRVIATTKQSGSSSEIAVRLFDEVQHLADTDLPAIVALAQGSQYKAFADLLVGYWAERDLEAAKKWMLGLPPSAQTGAAEGISATWCRANPHEFLTWLEALPDDARKTVIDCSAYSIVRGVGVPDYARAMHF